MKLFNTYEIAGILISVLLMAGGLWVVKSGMPEFSFTNTKQDTEPATVVVADEAAKRLENKLVEAFSVNGTLAKLVVEDIKEGEGKEVAVGDVVVVHYRGATQDGVEFDNSYSRNQPFIFTVGEGTVIKGWDEGLVGMKVGGNRVLVIPSDMAYGNRQVGVIPPNAPLLFAIELLEIR